MSEINKIVEHVKQATRYQANKRALKESMVAELHMPYNGGLFYLTPALMAFVKTWPDDKLFIEDTYENPIEIDREEFMKQARERYHSVMNQWHQQNQELRSARKV